MISENPEGIWAIRADATLLKKNPYRVHITAHLPFGQRRPSVQQPVTVLSPGCCLFLCFQSNIRLFTTLLSVMLHLLHITRFRTLNWIFRDVPQLKKARPMHRRNELQSNVVTALHTAAPCNAEHLLNISEFLIKNELWHDHHNQNTHSFSCSLLSGTVTCVTVTQSRASCSDFSSLLVKQQQKTRRSCVFTFPRSATDGFSSCTYGGAAQEPN